MKILFLIAFFTLGLAAMVKGDDEDNHKDHDEKEHSKHDHSKEEKEEAHDDHNHGKKGKEDKHSDHGKEGEREETKNVGPNKGITSFDKGKGFTLSKEAAKSFSIKTEVITGNGPWVLPESALLLTGEEKNIYRFRDGAFKRVDILIVEKIGSKILVKSFDLVNGDSVVVKGVGFIRTAEVDATSGESGHSH